MKKLAVIVAVLGTSIVGRAHAQTTVTGEGTVSTGDGTTASGSATIVLDAAPAVAPPPDAAPRAYYVEPPTTVIEPGELEAPHRIFGLGTAFGGGIAGAGAYTTSASTGVYVLPAIELPTLEALIFIDDHLSIDITIPLWNTIVVAAFAGYVPWATNILLDFSIGDDWVRFIVGPEIGFSFVDYGRSYAFQSAQINIGALVGVELLSRGRLFGFRIMSRPAIGIAFTSASSDAVAIGGNALFELALISYFTDG